MGTPIATSQGVLSILELSWGVDAVRGKRGRRETGIALGPGAWESKKSWLNIRLFLNWGRGWLFGKYAEPLCPPHSGSQG